MGIDRVRERYDKKIEQADKQKTVKENAKEFEKLMESLEVYKNSENNPKKDIDIENVLKRMNQEFHFSNLPKKDNQKKEIEHLDYYPEKSNDIITEEILVTNGDVIENEQPTSLINYDIKLDEYKIKLKYKYGKYWQLNLNESEKEEYIELYCLAYNVSKEVAFEDFLNSISLANEIKNKELEDKEYDRLFVESFNKKNDLTKDIEKIIVFPELLNSKQKLKDSIEQISSNPQTLDQVKSNIKKLDEFKIELENLNQKSIELDKIRSEEKTKQHEKYREFSNVVMQKYGKHWYKFLTTEERKEYVNLYSTFHEVASQEVEKRIDDSIELANKEIEKDKYNQRLMNNKTKIYKQKEELIGRVFSLDSLSIFDKEKEELTMQINNIVTNPKDENDSNNTLDELQRLSNEIDEIENKINKINQREEDKINDYIGNSKKLNELEKVYNKKYGIAWHINLSDKEKEEYIKLYSVVHNVSIDISKIMFNDITISLKKEKLEEEKQELQELKNQDEMKLDNSLTDSIEAITNDCVKRGVDLLKEIYSKIDMSNNIQVNEFNRLYSKLSNVSKMKCETKKEFEEKKAMVEKIYEEIETLNLSQEQSKGTR